MPHAEALAPALLERVLSKLGLFEPPAPTLEGLRTLYPAWCRKVPFDNIRQLIHRRSHDPSPMPGGDAFAWMRMWGARPAPCDTSCTRWSVSYSRPPQLG